MWSWDIGNDSCNSNLFFFFCLWIHNTTWKTPMQNFMSWNLMYQTAIWSKTFFHQYKLFFWCCMFFQFVFLYLRCRKAWKNRDLLSDISLLACLRWPGMSWDEARLPLWMAVSQSIDNSLWTFRVCISSKQNTGPSAWNQTQQLWYILRLLNEYLHHKTNCQSLSLSIFHWPILYLFSKHTQHNQDKISSGSTSWIIVATANLHWWVLNYVPFNILIFCSIP